MNVRADASLAPYNTLALAANATALVDVTSSSAVQEAVAYARASGLSALPLGEGSNVVLAGDIDALVLRLCTQGIEQVGETNADVTLRVAAGENWHRFAQWTLDQGYYGLENLALIPGTVGAAPIQNIGAYGVELCEFVTRVEGVNLEDGSALSLSGEQCRFSYRDSVFKGELRDRVVLTHVEMRLHKAPSPNLSYPALAEALAGLTGAVTPQAIFQAVVALRQSKLPDPAQTPNAGSFFKNPVIESDAYQLLAERFDVPGFAQADGRFKVPAAWLIEHCGWKGHRRSDQGVHPAHALVIVNYGNGSGQALLSLAQAITDDVQERFGVALEIEPRVYGATG